MEQTEKKNGAPSDERRFTTQEQKFAETLQDPEEKAGEDSPYGDEGSPDWTPEGAETASRQGLLGRIASPFNDSFNSLDSKQKGMYILIIGIASIAVGLFLMVRLIIRFA